MKKIVTVATSTLALLAGLGATVGCDSNDQQQQSKPETKTTDPYALNSPPEMPELTYGESWESPGGYEVTVDASVAEEPDDPDAEPWVDTWPEWQEYWSDVGTPEAHFKLDEKTPVEVNIELVNHTGRPMDTTWFTPLVFTENMVQATEIIYPENVGVNKVPDGETAHYRWVYTVPSDKLDDVDTQLQVDVEGFTLFYEGDVG